MKINDNSKILKGIKTHEDVTMHGLFMKRRVVCINSRSLSLLAHYQHRMPAGHVVFIIITNLDSTAVSCSRRVQPKFCSRGRPNMRSIRSLIRTPSLPSIMTSLKKIRTAVSMN